MLNAGSEVAAAPGVLQRGDCVLPIRIIGTIHERYNVKRFISKTDSNVKSEPAHASQNDAAGQHSLQCSIHGFTSHVRKVGIGAPALYKLSLHPRSGLTLSVAGRPMPFPGFLFECYWSDEGAHASTTTSALSRKDFRTAARCKSEKHSEMYCWHATSASAVGRKRYGRIRSGSHDGAACVHATNERPVVQA